MARGVRRGAQGALRKTGGARRAGRRARAGRTDKQLYHLPLRKTDKASVITKGQVVYKLNVAPNKTVVYLKRCGRVGGTRRPGGGGGV